MVLGTPERAPSSVQFAAATIEAMAIAIPCSMPRFRHDKIAPMYASPAPMSKIYVINTISSRP